jgi:hypothetical protein
MNAEEKDPLWIAIVSHDPSGGLFQRHYSQKRLMSAAQKPEKGGTKEGGGGGEEGGEESVDSDWGALMRHRVATAVMAAYWRMLSSARAASRSPSASKNNVVKQRARLSKQMQRAQQQRLGNLARAMRNVKVPICTK